MRWCSVPPLAFEDMGEDGPQVFDFLFMHGSHGAVQSGFSKGARCCVCGKGTNLLLYLKK